MTTFSLLVLAALIIPLFGAQSSADGSQPSTCNACCQGPTGLKGERGTIGHVGVPGPHGPRGPQGSKGEIQKSAFSVFKTKSQYGYTPDVLKFQVEQTNVGSHYNMGTNKFTCQIAGTYVFMFTVASYSKKHNPLVKLVKDGSDIAGVYISDSEQTDKAMNFHQSSNMAILQLSVGNKVWLQFVRSTVFGEKGKYSSFSGFLLYAE